MISKINKKVIKIKFMNGINYNTGTQDILDCVSDNYEFIEENENPDFILFGPYGNDIPPLGKHTRIAYYCENFTPDMTICDWAFGVPYEEEVKHPRYTRIQWHGFDPNLLIKKNLNIEKIIAQKTKFCNFIYTHRIPFREKFYKQLSKYKHIDAPGKSMNNSPSIDIDQSQGDTWERKRKFISQYKFTIAFENYSYPGYNTEKLLDPMVVDSLPIYWGNPFIEKHFNCKSFINTHEYIKTHNHLVVRMLETYCQPNFIDMRPVTHNSLINKIRRKMKMLGREMKLNIQYNFDFDELITKITEIDNDINLYAKYLSQPWFYENKPPANQAVVSRWKKIFG